MHDFDFEQLQILIIHLLEYRLITYCSIEKKKKLKLYIKTNVLRTLVASILAIRIAFGNTLPEQSSVIVFTGEIKIISLQNKCEKKIFSLTTININICNCPMIIKCSIIIRQKTKKRRNQLLIFDKRRRTKKENNLSRLNCSVLYLYTGRIQVFDKYKKS